MSKYEKKTQKFIDKSLIQIQDIQGHFYRLRISLMLSMKLDSKINKESFKK